MQHIYIYSRNLLLIGMLVTIIGGCKKSFLEILPKGVVIATKTSDYDLLLNQLDLINIPSNSQVLMGDEVSAIDPAWTGANFKEKQLFKWEADLYLGDEDATETLIPTKNIYVYNKIINEVMNATEGTEIVKKSIQAEAYAGRAWANFLLIQYFGKPYNAATAASDPGFPLITESDINATDFRRASVQQIYDQIISDLTIAIPNISSDGVPFRSRMSKCAAQGLLAKVYVFMGRYAEALPLLDAAIGNLSKSTVNTAIVNYNTSFQGSPTIVNDIENIYAKNMTYPYAGASNRLLYLTPEAARLYASNDTRFIRFFALSITYPAVAPAPALTLYKRTITGTYNIGLKVPELYLLRAEVKARMDDRAGAVTDLEFLRKNRLPDAVAATPNTPAIPAQWLVPTAASASILSLVQFVMEERIREFAITGYRWFDMRRLSVDPLFTTPVYQHKVYNAAGVVSETFTLKPDRFQLRFSPKIIGENPNLGNNP